MKQSYRYPGTRSFQKEDADIFFGREEDVRQLLRLIRLEKLVILHGKSGLGKTSLLNAGLLPVLESAPAAPAADEPDEERPATEVQEIRFGAYQAEMTDLPVDVLKQQIQAEAPMHPLVAQWAEGPDSLWYYFKSKQLSDRDDRTTLLVFDQFEELFTYPESELEHFKKEFSDLLNGHVPDIFQKNMIAGLREDRKAVSREDKRWLNKPLNVKVIIGIRSDRLSLLDQFTDQAPNMLVNLYELKPLNREQARSAIVQPAEKRSAVYLTPPFTYDAEAIETMLDALSNDQGEIESFQLQLLCQYLENQVLEDPELRTILTERFGGREGVQTILNNYYEREIGKLPEKDQTIARRFIEEGLIINEKRVAVAAGSEQARFGVSENLLQRLLDSRLIREGNIHLGKIYELSHDTLVEPVLKSYEKRKTEEERLATEREIARQKKQLQKEKRRRQRARVYAILGFTLFLLALIAGLLAWRNAQAAKKQERQAKAAALAAKAWAVYRNDHTLAFRIAESAFKIDPDNQQVKQTLLDIINSTETSFYQKIISHHQFEIEDIAFSSDSKYFATCSKDSDVRVWTREGEPAHWFKGKFLGDQFPGHKNTVTGLSFSPDNRLLVSVGLDGMVKIWDLAGDSLLREFRGQGKQINAICFSHADQWFVTAGADSVANIWTLDGTRKHTLSGHRGIINAVAVSQDDRLVLTAGRDGSAILWDSSTGQAIDHFSNQDNPVLAVAFLPDGQHFVWGSGNKTAEIWHIKGKKLRSLGGHNGQVIDVAVAPDGSFVMTASDDATAKIWSLGGEEILTLAGHSRPLNTVTISPDGATILTGGWDYTARLWNVAFNLDIQRNKHTNFIYSTDVSSDNSSILTAGRDNTAKMWNFEGRMLTDFIGHQASVQSAMFVPDKEEVLTASLDGSVKIWDWSGAVIAHLEHKEPVFSVECTPGRKEVISGTQFGKVFIWGPDGRVIKQWQAGSNRFAVFSMDISPDQDKLITSQGNIVKMWTLEGEFIDSIVNPYTDMIYKVLFAADGQSFYTAGREFPLRKWSLQGELIQSYYGHQGEIYGLRNHPTLPYVISTSWDRTAKIWNRQGQLIQNFIHPDGVYTATFSQDGRQIVTGSRDYIGRIWDMDGNLINALGERVNIEQTAQAQEVAKLSEIPFRMSELDIPLEYSLALFGDGPDRYLAEGQEYQTQAATDPSDPDKSIELFDQAIHTYKIGLELSDSNDQIPWNTILASAYKEKGELLFINEEFKKAIQCFSEGLQYEEQNYLLILQTLAYLFDGQFQKAEGIADSHKEQPVPEIEYYQTYADAYLGELSHFSVQFGLTHPDTERFKALFEE